MRKSTILFAFLLVVTIGLLMLMTRDKPMLYPKPVDTDSLSVVLPPGFVAVTATPSGQNQIVITWQSEVGAKDQLLRSSGAGGDWFQVVGATSSPVKLSATSKFELFKLARNAPLAPTNVIVYFNAATPTVWRLQWKNQCANCDSIIVLRAHGNRGWTQIAQLGGLVTNYTDNSAPGAGTNYYVVQSVKNGVKSTNL